MGFLEICLFHDPPRYKKCILFASVYNSVTKIHFAKCTIICATRGNDNVKLQKIKTFLEVWPYNFPQFFQFLLNFYNIFWAKTEIIAHCVAIWSRHIQLAIRLKKGSCKKSTANLVSVVIEYQNENYYKYNDNSIS